MVLLLQQVQELTFEGEMLSARSNSIPHRSVSYAKLRAAWQGLMTRSTAT